MTVILVVLGGVLGCASTPADAHPLSTSAILLDTEPDHVDGVVQLPIDRLEIALNQPLNAQSIQQPFERERLRRYVATHTSASEAGVEWNVDVRGGRVETLDGVDHLVFELTLTPPNGVVTKFDLHYDGIVEHLLSHQIFVASRPGNSGDYTTVGVLDWQHQQIAVSPQGATVSHGFVASVHLGIKHIAQGADHLLFLMMLLLPAPLLARKGRWVRSDSLKGNGLRVVHVVTSFAIGHSITLVLGALGYIHAPTRLVESMIALSILVSAIHAIRPLAPGGEAWIATGFGLMHGLAFAALIGELDLGGRSLIADLFGFNVGIELTQLIVVALMMPSLLVLSRTRVYSGVRITIAGIGVVFASMWLAERTTLLSSNPLNRIANIAIDHPFLVAAAIATFAVTVWSVPTLRQRAIETDTIPRGHHGLFGLQWRLRRGV